ncbi:MAG: hypothetical protein Tsb002_26420 [Wenzhouxiangellaceae bacterium]
MQDGIGQDTAQQPAAGQPLMKLEALQQPVQWRAITQSHNSAGKRRRMGKTGAARAVFRQRFGADGAGASQPGQLMKTGRAQFQRRLGGCATELAAPRQQELPEAGPNPVNL